MKVLLLDCLTVGVGSPGPNSKTVWKKGKPSGYETLARVSIVNENGKVVYDEFVKPSQRVTDYRYVKF